MKLKQGSRPDESSHILVFRSGISWILFFFNYATELPITYSTFCFRVADTGFAQSSSLLYPETEFWNRGSIPIA